MKLDPSLENVTTFFLGPITKRSYKFAIAITCNDYIEHINLFYQRVHMTC